MTTTTVARGLASRGSEGPSLAGAERSNSRLWIVLASLIATLHMAVAFLTQSSVAGLLAVSVWGGAFLCLEDRIPTLRPAPSVAGFFLGFVLVAAGLWRTAQVAHWDVVFYGLPVVLGFGLALLYLPFRRLGEFRDALLALFLLPVAIIVFKILPEERIGEVTAQLTKVLLMAIGVDSRVEGRLVLLQGGGVLIQGPCSGIEQVAQLIIISAIFLLAFRMRSWWRRSIMLVLAPALAVVGNSFRIAFLAIVNASEWAAKEKLFNFFHDENGALIFAGLTVAVFGWVYLRVLEPELSPVRAKVAHG